MNTTKEKEEVPKNKDVEEMDAIPTLELPPPMIPCKIYGHHYLDKKIQVFFSSSFFFLHESYKIKI